MLPTGNPTPLPTFRSPRPDAPTSQPAPSSSRRRGEEPNGSFASVVNIFVDFFELAVHTILAERRIYPAEVFYSLRKYGTSVRRCRAPKVNSFIRDAVDVVTDELLAGALKVVSVVILSPNQVALERYNFDVASFAAAAGFDVEEHELDDLKLQLHTAMVGLNHCGAKLGGLPDDCTWTVALNMSDVSEQALMDHDKRAARSRDGTHQAAGYTPSSTVDAGALELRIWVEEGTLKETIPAVP